MNNMKTWYIDYIASDGDYCHIWVEAPDSKSAVNNAYREYYDIDSIVSVREKK